ncbi:unnamed protein product [Rhizophagus irregularis]|uniref:Uncharacterized protein n=1 Tax=Rhizophagus irregularis TaxID=588596 RepID=A0A2I1HFL1_9GLOM|nr:hypothetical protein RhiirA4_429136 [Rhizophagus irregularis]CAB4443436.1 unnamed protein product [Rhizophagus irregularis]
MWTWKNIKICQIIKEYKENYGGHFAKIIKVNKIKHIQIYYNNEQDLMKAVYDSEMQENIGGGIQINELIGKDLLKDREDRREIPSTNIACASSEDDKFFEATENPTDQTVLTIETIKLNAEFSERIQTISGSAKRNRK